jgi:hypothetical protein
MIYTITGLESHPDGTVGLNGIINGNWQRLEDIFSPLGETQPPGTVVGWDAGNQTLAYVAYGGAATYTRHVQLVAKADGTVANQPTPAEYGTAGGLQFPTTGTKYAYCQFEVPDDWDGTNMFFEIDWLPDSGAMGGTDTVEWTINYRAIAEGEVITQGTVKTLSVADSGDYSQGQTKHTRFTLPFNDANQPLTKQDHVFVQITRNTGVANDFGGTVLATGYELIYESTGYPTT